MNGRPKLPLAAHHHSFKRIKHDHTSYPVLIFLMVVAGILLFGVTQISFAQQTESVYGNILVQAAVLSPPPGIGATIATPITGQHLGSPELVVTGGCSPGRLVKIIDNGTIVGTGLCSSSGRYSIPIILFQGPNILSANNYDAAGQSGPETPSVTVIYDAPASTGAPKPVAPLPIIIKGPSTLRGYYIGDTTPWPLEVSGGRAPYTINIDWGDGQSDAYSKAVAGSFDATHVYDKAGGFNGSYNVTITVVDAAGTLSKLQLVILIQDRVKALAAGRAHDSGGLAIAWPIWIATGTMLVTFWLGELAMKRFMNSRFMMRRLRT